MRQVRQIMGLPVSIDIPSCRNQSVFERVFDRLRQIDERFSTYKPQSEVSRYRRGEIKDDELSPELKKIIKASRQAEKLTNGYFSAWYDSFDPSGYVKGWAIAEAGEEIRKLGLGTFCIGAGGDILAASDSGKTWRIGIQDPRSKSGILDLLSISNGAVATSGNYERGLHIIDPVNNKPADELLSVSVTGPDIIRADVLATAAFAMGEAAADFMPAQTGYASLIIRKNGERIRTGGFGS